MKTLLRGTFVGLVLFSLVSCRSANSDKDKSVDASFEAFRHYVVETVHDQARSEALIAMGAELRSLLTEDFGALQEKAARLSRLNAGYHTTRAELESALAEINAQRKLIRVHILAARTRAVALTTPEEWQRFTKRDKSLMDMFEATPGLL